MMSRVSFARNIADNRCTAAIEQLWDEVTTFQHIRVELELSPIRVQGFVLEQPRNPVFKIGIRPFGNQSVYLRMVATIGQVLQQNFPQLTEFHCSVSVHLDYRFPEVWRGLATNRVLKEVTMSSFRVPDGPDTTRFLISPALESLSFSSCNFVDRAFASFCQGIATSTMRHLEIRSCGLAPGDSWVLLWSALARGAAAVESLSVVLQREANAPIVDGFEAFLTNNTTIQNLHLDDFLSHRESVAFVGALGRALAVNKTVKQIQLPFSYLRNGGPSDEELIRTMFAEGFNRNVSVERLRICIHTGPKAVDALLDGLEKMMLHRASAAMHDAGIEADSRPVLKEFDITLYPCHGIENQTTQNVLDYLLRRLGRNDVIPIEKLTVKWNEFGMTMPQAVLDLVRSTRVLRSLDVSFFGWNPNDAVFTDLVNAMETNKSVAELTIGRTEFHTATNLLSFPNKYRIRFWCRRNEIRMDRLRDGSNMSALPLVLSRLLTDDKAADGDDHSKMEACRLVDRSLAFELLKDVPELFTSAGHSKRQRVGL